MLLSLCVRAQDAPGCIFCHTIAMHECDDFDFGDPCAKAAQRTRVIVCIEGSERACKVLKRMHLREEQLNESVS